MSADCFLVTENQEAIAEARKLSIAQANTGLDEWIDPSRCIHGFVWVRQFQINSAEVLQRSEALRQEPVCFERLERMIQLLISLRHPRWIEFFEIIIRSASTGTKAKLLHNIRDRLTGDSRATWAHAAVVDHFLPAVHEAALSEEYELRARAMHLLVDIQHMDARAALFSAVLAGLQTGWVYRLVLEKLFLDHSHDAQTVGFADRVATLILGKEINAARDFTSEERHIMYYFTHLLELCAHEGDDLVRLQSASISRRVFVAWKQDGSKCQRENLATLAMAIGRGASDADVGWLHSTFERERHTRSAAGLLVGLVRLCGKQGRELLIAALNAPKCRKSAWQSCSIVLKATGDSEVLNVIELSAAKIASPSDLNLAAQAVVAIGGAQADQLIDAWKDRLDSFDHYMLTVDRQPRKSDLAAQDAVSLGLITNEALKGALKLYGAHFPCGIVSHAFWLEGRAAYISSIAGPDDLFYKELLLDFAEASGGAFSPESPTQLEFSEGVETSTSPEIEALLNTAQQRNLYSQEKPSARPVIVQFINEDRLYQVSLRGSILGANGPTYDAQRFVSVVNKALADSGKKERFIGIDDHSSSRPFVFADPAVLLPFAQKHHVTLLPNDLWMS